MARRLTLILLALLFSPLAVMAQRTQVSAQLQDGNGDLYVNCSGSASFVGQNSTPGSGPYLLNGSTFQTVTAINCDSNANFSVTLADNNAVSPSPSQWAFSLCSTSGYVGGPYCKTTLVTITGATQNITSTLSAVMPVLPQTTGTINLAAPPRIGNVTPNTGAFTTLTANSLTALAEAGCQHVNGSQSFATALAALAGSGCMVIDPGTYAVSVNSSIPANTVVYFQGGAQLNPANAVTLTFDVTDTIVAGTRQIFGGAGSVVTPPLAYPEWWGNNGTCVSGACPLVSVAVNALNTTVPGTVILGCSTYRSGFEEHVNVATLTRQGVKIVGCGMPQYASNFTSFVAGTGTIIQGSWSVEADNFAMSNVGIDVGSVVDSTLYASAGEDAFIMNNNGQVVGKTPKKNPTLINIACLGQSASAAFHCFLLENVSGGYVENIHAVFNTHGVVLKGDHTTINGVYSQGHNTDGVIVKSDDYAPTNNDSLSNLHIDVVNAGDTASGVVINPQAAVMSNVNIANVTVGGLGGTGDGIVATLNFASDHISISNVDIKSGTKQSVCFHVQGTTAATAWQLNNLACDNYNYLVFQTQFLSTSTLSNLSGTNIGNGSNTSMLLEGVGEVVSNVVATGTFTTGVLDDCATCTLLLSNWSLPGFAGTLVSATNGAIVSAGANTFGTNSVAGFYGGGAVTQVTIGTVTPVAIGTSSGTGTMYILRDNTNGGTAIVLNDANGGPSIIGGVGTTAFVTGAPTATQVQVTNVAGQLKVLGGASRNNAVIVVAQLGN